ncbi:MAG: hypothetical protein KBB75_00280 [Candidatus Pacebacteria bacterium]|jgi:hypothetical protein|nr:hypothetical protein [Candidatus Paceibacterota bacterium]
MTSKTFISEVSDVYGASLAELLRDSKEGSVKIQSKVGGIDCTQLSVLSDHPAFSKLFAQNSAEFKVREKLSKSGLEFEGILPLEFLESLRMKFTLFKFLNVTSDGKVFGLFKKQDTESVWMKILMHISIYLPMGLVVILDSFIPICMYVPMFLALKYLDDLSLTKTGEFFLKFLALLSVPILFVWGSIMDVYENSQGYLKKQMWGEDYSDEKFLKLTKKERNSRGVDLVSIQIVPAPLEVQKRLISWSQLGYTPSLLVAKEAFRVNVESEEFKKKWQVWNDPMPFVVIEEDGHSFAVIIHQYGTFPKEKEMLEYVKEHFNVLRKKYELSSN